MVKVTQADQDYDLIVKGKTVTAQAAEVAQAELDTVQKMIVNRDYWLTVAQALLMIF
jgi:hypothetical protein